MIRLRASMISLRRTPTSPLSCGSLAAGGTDRGVLVSSAIRIMLRERAGTPGASHGRGILAPFCVPEGLARSVLPRRGRVVVRLQEVQLQADGEEVPAHV